jgi:hypothetical protein
MEKLVETGLGNSKFYLGDENIIYFDIGDDFNEDSVFKMRNVFNELLEMNNGITNMYIEGINNGKPSLTVRKTFIEMTEHEQLGKVAILGNNPVVRVIASFIIGVSRNRNMRIFKTKDEALDWLKI